ncbi:CBS domain-containing protein [Cupriavidus necator]|uniref:CBS domain-containing protein n=1 Tax=Cupriavidus necator TaxID=106590 RepID=UPI00339D58B9
MQTRNISQTTNASLRLRDVMTRDPVYVGRDDSIQQAAKLMDDLNIGALPVCMNGRLEGMITDRDITVRCTAAGRNADAKVSEAMSTGTEWCREDDTVDDARAAMAERQIRRMPVVDRDNKLVGMVSLGDIATKSGEIEKTGDTFAEVSNPSAPDR